MPPVQSSLLDACRTLFGDEVNLGPEFLAYLQPSGAKVAFRNQAKQHHPDRFPGATPDVRARQTARFREIHQAYHLLNNYLEQRPRPRRPEPVLRTRPTAPRPSAPRQSGPGNLPPLPMEFGIFAYYRGVIAYADLIDALVWQRRQRPALGAIACQWGWLTEAKIRRILSHRGTSGRFGRKAVEIGLLSPLQVEALLHHQRSQQQRLGQYFVDRSLLTSAEADALARDLQRHNAQVASSRR